MFLFPPMINRFVPLSPPPHPSTPKEKKKKKNKENKTNKQTTTTTKKNKNKKKTKKTKFYFVPSLCVPFLFFPFRCLGQHVEFGCIGS